MNVPLSPVTREKLIAFDRHRRKLVRRRGACATLFTVLGVVTLVALIDWLVVLSDELRWMLSAGAYALIGLVAWVLWIRPALRRPDLRQLARFVETARPTLREDLLSAVELGTEDSATAQDSPLFRAILQASVARRIRGVVPEALLPPRLIRLWVGLAVVSVLLFGVLFTLPDLHFGKLVVRAMLPMANVARVSRTTVTVIEPSPPDAVVPQGDVVTVLVELSGPEVDEIVIETFREEGDSGSMGLLPAEGERRYRARLQTDEHPLIYRIRAGDALTRKYTITTRLRPYVTGFDITYHPPAYTGWPAHTETGLRRGDLEILAGSDVTLVLHTDQPVSEATIELEQGGHLSVQPVELSGPTRLTASFGVRFDGEYKVRLLAAETSFDNGRYSPRYEIRALPDQVPEVVVERPAKDLLVPADEIIDIEGTARDDVGLTRVAHATRLNGGPWVDEVLAEGDGLPARPDVECRVRRAWDLRDLELKPGDRITSRLVAVDLKGSRGESRPWTVTIGSPGFTLASHEALIAARGALEALSELETRSREVQKAGREAEKGVDSRNADSLEGLARRQAELLDQLGRKAADVEERVREALGLADGGADAHELSSVSRVLSRMREEWVRQTVDALEDAGRQGDTALLREATRRARESSGAVVREVSETRRDLEELIAADEASALLEDLIELDREQERILEMGGGHVERWVRRQRATARQMEEIEKRFAGHRELHRSGQADSARKVTEHLRAAREELARHLEGGREPSGVEEGSRRVAERLRQARWEWTQLHASSDREADKARRRVSSRTEPLDGVLRKLSNEVRKLEDGKRRLADRLERSGGASVSAEERARLNALEAEADRWWETAADLSQAHAEIEETRSDSNPLLVADLDLARRAVEALRIASAPSASPAEASSGSAGEALSALANASRKLEAGHGVTELRRLLADLQAEERWSFASPRSLTRHPEGRDRAHELFWSLPDRMREAELSPDAHRRFVEVRGSQEWRDVYRLLDQRRGTLKSHEPVDGRLRVVTRGLREVESLLAEDLAAARASLAAVAPSLSEMMAGLSERAGEASEVTSRAAAEAEAPEGLEPGPGLEQALEEHEDLAEGVEQLVDALRRDANVQDPLTDEGRERARDADDAVALVGQPVTEARQSLDRALASTTESAGHLEDAAGHQEDLARTLSELADHYERLEAGVDVADSRAALRQAEEALGIQNPLEQQFEATSRLAELAQLSPAEMLEALEEELGRSPGMQEELRGISSDSLQEARQQLEASSEAERSVESRMEQVFKSEARRSRSLAERLERIGKKAAALASGEIPGMTEEAAKGAVAADDDIRGAERALKDAAQEARGGSPESPSPAVARAAEAAAGLLSEAQGALEAVGESAREAGSRAAQAARDAAGGDADARRSRQEAQAAQRAADRARGKAQSLAGQARSLAQQARRIAQEAASSPLQAEAALQEGIAGTVGEAGETVERVGRHADRLGNTALGENLGAIARGIEGVATGEVPAAGEALERGNPEAAREGVVGARAAIDEQAARLDELGSGVGGVSEPAGAGTPAGDDAGSAQASSSGTEGSPGQPGQDARPGTPAAPGEGAPLAAGTAPAMARALDQLDQSLFGSEGAPASGGEPGAASSATPSSASGLLGAAAASQARSLRQARSGEGLVPSRSPSSEGFAVVSRGGAAVLGQVGPVAVALPAREEQQEPEDLDWGKLPPKLARDLLEGRREKVAEEYRAMVETYFRVIAEKAREGAR